MKTRFALALVVFSVALAPATIRAEDQDTQSQNSQPQYSETPTDRGACVADAFTVCAQFIPNRERVGDCLMANSSRISLPCREAIKHFVPETATR
jgi:hypothetical protein